MEEQILIHQSADHIVFQSPRLALAFQRDPEHARWSHAVSLSDQADLSSPIASSLEWHTESESAEHDRVLSPVYQDLRVERQADGSAIVFALGKSGPHHFASTFHMTLGDQTQAHSETRIEIDVADRCSTPFEWLAATYAIHAPASRLAWATDSGASWEWPASHGLLVLESAPATADNQQCAVAEAGRAACRAQIITPANPRKATQRLIYRFLARS
jgi:hypothetical protein